jgi:sugar lactone lactonase YvrE
MKGKKYMKTISKFVYAAFAVVILAVGAVTANAGRVDLFASINGDPPRETGGFIYRYRPTGVFMPFASGLARPRGVAFGTGGSLFVATNSFDDVTGTFQVSIVKITPDGVQSTVATLSGDLFAEGVAFDVAGNLFVMAIDNTDPNFASTIYEITPGGSISTFGSVPGQGFGLAFDSAGNLFAADNVDQTIYEFAPDGTRSVFVTTSVGGPGDLAFDRSGNLFASVPVDFLGNDLILEYTPDGVESTFATGLTAPRGLAFDRSGNLFVAEIITTGPGDILKFTPDGTRTVFAVVPGGDNSGPEFLAIQRSINPH